MLSIKALLTKILTELQSIRSSLGMTTRLNDKSFTASAANTWQCVGSFTLTKSAICRITSTYTVRTIGLGFSTSSTSSLPDLGYTESTTHMYSSPAYLLPARTIYVYTKVNSPGTNKYSVYSFG